MSQHSKNNNNKTNKRKNIYIRFSASENGERIDEACERDGNGK